MNDKLKKLELEINLALKKERIIVDSIVYETEGTVNFLRITLDRVNGIDLETIVMATNIIDPIVEKNSPVDETYILDITSKERKER